MTHTMSGRRNAKRDFILKARRQLALDRPELRQPSVARASPAGPTSYPIKAEDQELRALIDEALARRA